MIVFWDKLKGKVQTAYTNRLYFFELLDFVTGIFDWTLPDGVDPKFLERYLNASGMCALTKNEDGEYRLSLGGLEDPLDQYAIGTKWIGETLGGEYCTGVRGETAAVCFNNSDQMPNFDLVPVSDRLTEFDKSIRAVTRASRANPLTVAHDKKTVKAFEEVHDKILDGDIVSILSDNALDDLGGRQAVEVIEFTKPEYMRLLQYLYEAKESEYRNFYRKYGQNLQSVAKHAQVTTEEIDGADSVCFIIPRDMLEQRKRFCEEASRIFGDTFAVEFAEPWRSEEQRYDADTTEQLAEADKAEAEAEQVEAETEQIEIQSDQIEESGTDPLEETGEPDVDDQSGDAQSEEVETDE